MTRTQAWRTVAEAFGTPQGKRTETQRETTDTGLCWGLAVALGLNRFGTSYLAQRLHIMRQVGKGLSPTNSYLSGWPPWASPSGDRFRATLAGLMAAMTQRERDRLVPGL